VAAAPPIQHRAANRTSLGILAIGIKRPIEEYPDFIDECVAPAFRVNEFARHNRRLVIAREPHDLYSKIHDLLHTGPILTTLGRIVANSRKRQQPVVRDDHPTNIRPA
jgi:hypothetical protein